MAEITKNPYSMCESATASQAYWELDLFGVVLFSILPAIYVYFSIILFSTYGLIAFPLFYCIFKWEYLEPKLWISAIVLQIFQINFPAYIFSKINKMLVRK